MWPFNRGACSARSLINRGFTDWHSHILPGVDDGVKTMDEALAILDRWERLGIAEVWLTPHIMEDIPNTTEALRERCSELVSAYKGSVVLHLGSENMLDNLFEKRLEKNDLLPVGENGDILLVETSYFNPPMALYEMLGRIRSKGYTPLLAHPERYMYMDYDDYTALKDSGVLFQLNLLSLCGLYGRTVRNKAEKLKRKGLYDCAGTDIHNAAVAENFL